MRQRPWPILVLALIQIVMPFVSLIMNAFLTRTPLMEYFKIYTETRSTYDVIDFLFIFPLAGVALLIFSRWSYLLFVGIFTWIIFSKTNLLVTTAYTNIFNWLDLIPNIFNIMFLSYFLLPQVRRVYFDRRLRWWESKPRYEVNFPATMSGCGYSEPCWVKNISEGGVLIKTKRSMKEGDQIIVYFDVLNSPLGFNGEVVHAGPGTEVNEFGIKFDLNRKDKATLHHLMQVLYGMGGQMALPKEDVIVSLNKWFSDLVKGKGWVPMEDQKDKSKF